MDALRQANLELKKDLQMFAEQITALQLKLLEAESKLKGKKLPKSKKVQEKKLLS